MSRVYDDKRCDPTIYILILCADLWLKFYLAFKPQYTIVWYALTNTAMKKEYVARR